MESGLFKIIIILLSLLYIITSCTNEEIYFGDLLNEYIYKEKNIYIPDDFIPGKILMVENVNNEEYILLDFSYRMMFNLNNSENKINQIGKHGEGPGEYRNPIFFRILENEKIAFTDISNMYIQIIDKYGNHISQLEHGHGGGRQFFITEDNIFIRGNLTHNLHVYDYYGNNIKNIFPIKEEYKNQIRHIDGGGLTYYDDKIYLINSIEPAIYMYDIYTGDSLRYSPLEWEIFEMNDGYSLENHSVNELGEVIDKIVLFGKIHIFTHNNDKYIIVQAKKGNINIMYYLNNRFEVEYSYIPDEFVIGYNGKYLYQRNVDSESSDITKIGFSIFD